jgi:hypothetical protein
MEDYLMLEIDDEREHIRQAREEKIVFQITWSAHDTLPPGTVVRCSTENISQRGLRVQLDRPLSEGSQLELGVEISNRTGVFFLTGEVKWCKSLDGRKRNLVGVEIKERQSGDFNLWHEALDNWSPICCDLDKSSL